MVNEWIKTFRSLDEQMMPPLKDQIIQTLLYGLYHSKAYKLLQPITQGCGVIFTLHQVEPARDTRPFDPNALLKVTPDFLENVIQVVLENDLEIVSLTEAYERLVQGWEGDRFVCFTFDDGYRDNYHYAYPIFKKYNIPFTVYVPSDYPEGKGELWWLALEEIIKSQGHIQLVMNDGLETFRCYTEEEKISAYHQIYWWLRQISEDRQRQVIRNLCSRYDLDFTAQCRRLIMDWEELRRLSSDPLVTIGGHTAGHYAIGKLGEQEALAQIEQGLSRLQDNLGVRPEHFSFPYGDRASAGSRDFEIVKHLGLKTAVTTRKGVLFPAHADHLTALPRVSLNGHYQSLKFIELYLSGAPFGLFNMFRRLDIK